MNLLERATRISQSAYSSQETLINTLQCASKVCIDRIPGDFVECGVGAGSQIAIMDVALSLFPEASKKIYAFDSYQGIPLACEKDDQQPGIGNIDPSKVKKTLEERLVSSGITVHSKQNVINNLKSWECCLNLFEFVEGWFQDTLPKSDVRKISLLRLDGDLYESTLVCLMYLFPKLQSGGILIIDDWALLGCRKACDEYFGDYSKALLPMHSVSKSTPVYFVKK